MFDREVLSAEVAREFYAISGGHIYDRIINQLWINKQYCDVAWGAHSTWWRKTKAGRAYDREYARQRSALLKRTVVEIRWCIACRKEFEVTAYKAKRKRGLVCSQRCAMHRAVAARAKTLYEINGVKRTLTEWLVGTGISVQTAWARLARGWAIKRAIEEPLTNRSARIAAA